jgi:ABC-type sugar transport system substrate-binding protein
MKRKIRCIIGLLPVALLGLAFGTCKAQSGNLNNTNMGRELPADYAKVDPGKGFFSIDNIVYGTPNSSLKIGCLVTENSPGFHHSIYEALQFELKANGVTCLISVCDNDVTKQVQQMENYIAQNVDGIIMLSATPVDGMNLVLEKAYDANIPVVAIDVFPDGEAKYLTGVFTDAYELAYRATRSVLETYKAKTGSYAGKLGIIGGIEGNTTANKRNQGMRDAVKDVTGGDMQEVSFIYCGGFTEELGLKAAENMLVQHPDINIILPTSEAIALGAIAACENAGISDQVMMATIDGSKNALRIIKDGGPIKAIGINSPVVVAQGGVRLLLAYIVDGTVPGFKEQVLEPEVASPENIDRYYDPNAIF